VRWSNIDKVLLKVYLFAEHNNKRHDIRTWCGGKGSGVTIDSAKLWELSIVRGHCTCNTIHTHIAHFGKYSTNIVKGSDIYPSLAMGSVIFYILTYLLHGTTLLPL
jgi:hypothetical protein